jgi:hypothetical protein
MGSWNSTANPFLSKDFNLIGGGDATASFNQSGVQRGRRRPQNGDGKGTSRCDIGAFEKTAR